MSLKRMIALVSILALSMTAPGTLLSTVNAAEEEVANINGTSISSDEFQKRMERLTREGQGNFDTPEGREELLDILISREVLNQEGKRLGLDKKKEVKERIEELTKEVMISEVVNQIANEKLTDVEMKKYYNKNKADFKEVHASHILVKTEEEAKEIKKKLDQGGDFAALAKEKSTDPGSAPRGGDLGFFTKDRMVKAFSDAAFSLKVNEISNPVQTPFGFHIIKVVETKEAKNFEELSPAQLQNIRGSMINHEIDELKEKAKIKINKNRLMQISSVPPDHSMGGPGEHSMSAPPSQK
jgi:peptidyl-prolyl cis-trans isomerase C